MSRRAFLAAGVLAPAAPGRRASAAEPPPAKPVSVILLRPWAAPRYLDTFDPKPKAAPDIRGPFGTIPTRTPGVRFTELFPKTAARSDQFALIPSMVNADGNHLKAGSIGRTGTLEGKTAEVPNFGSVVARHRGQKDLPSFTAVGRGNPRDVVGPMRGFGGGNRGRNYDPLLVGCSDTGETDIPALKLLDGLSPAALDDRRTLLGGLDRMNRDGGRSGFDRWDATQKRAYSLLTTPEARAALDLSREKAAEREAYGRTSFGQSGRRVYNRGAVE